MVSQVDVRQELDKKVDGISLDCSKCPMSREDCLSIMGVIKGSKGSYSVKAEGCLLKVLIRDAARFFHL